MIEIVSWTKVAWADYVHWQIEDKKTLKRINKLVQATMRHPFEGIGKPEPLKYELAGYWSRRIDLEHRLVYQIQDGKLLIYACRFHYD